VELIEIMSPAYKKSYMDDGGVVADVVTLEKVWQLLQSEGDKDGSVSQPHQV
jgi:hypothetical protein